jgi:hypothetical protein
MWRFQLSVGEKRALAMCDVMIWEMEEKVTSDKNV